MPLASVPAESKVEGSSAGKRNDGSDPGDGEAQPWFLIVSLRISFLVLWSIGHRYRRPIEHVNSTPFPKPLRIGLRVQSAPHQASDGREKLFRQTFSGLAVGTGLRGASALAPGNSMCDQSSNSGSARMIRANHLPQKDPESYQRRVDSVLPGHINCFQCWCDCFF